MLCRPMPLLEECLSSGDSPVIVLKSQAYRVRLGVESHQYTPGAAVLYGVGNRFLGDAVEVGGRAGPLEEGQKTSVMLLMSCSQRSTASAGLWDVAL